MFKYLIATTLLINLSTQAGWTQVQYGGLQSWLYQPKKSASKNALMVNLHGCSQKPDDLKKDGNWETAADDFSMLVILPLVPNGGKIMGCWDYYGDQHTRQNRDNQKILKMVEEILKDQNLNIDPKQVYISGLSSGGGESLVMACLAPDIFAGIGINAGPIIGTNSNEIGVAPKNYDSYLKACKKLISLNQLEKDIKTQITSIIYGQNDFIVNPRHDTMTAELLSEIYDAKLKENFETKKLEGVNNDGTGVLFKDQLGPRISLIQNTNLGHNWPAGQGGNGGNFINKKSINYPMYLARFFSENNRRVSQPNLPKIFFQPVIDISKRIYLKGEFSALISGISDIELKIREKSDLKVLETIKGKINNNEVEFLSNKLKDGEYDLEILINDQKNISVLKRNAWIGKIPDAMKPQLFNVDLESQKNCVKIKGQAIENGKEKIVSLDIFIDGRYFQSTTVEPTSFFEWSDCSLSYGSHQVIISAVNELGLRSNDVEFNLLLDENAVTSSILEHCKNQRIPWYEYSKYYLKYGLEPFTMIQDSSFHWHDKNEIYKIKY